MKQMAVLCLSAMMLMAVGEAARADIVVYPIQGDGTITHSFSPGSFDMDMYEPDQVRDTLASTWGSGTTIPRFTANLANDKTLKITFSAPAGMHFQVTPVAWSSGGDNVFGCSLSDGNGWSSPWGASTQSFEWLGATDNAPEVQTYPEYAFGLGWQTFSLQAAAIIESPFDFTGFEFTVSVPDGFNKNYDEFQLSGDVSFWSNSYSVGGSDPGSMVKTVAVPEPATLSLLLAGLPLLRRRRTSKV